MNNLSFPFGFQLQCLLGCTQGPRLARWLSAGFIRVCCIEFSAVFPFHIGRRTTVWWLRCCRKISKWSVTLILFSKCRVPESRQGISPKFQHFNSFHLFLLIPHIPPPCTGTAGLAAEYALFFSCEWVFFVLFFCRNIFLGFFCRNFFLALFVEIFFLGLFLWKFFISKKLWVVKTCVKSQAEARCICTWGPGMNWSRRTGALYTQLQPMFTVMFLNIQNI